MSASQFVSNKAILAGCLLSAAGALVFNAFPQILTAIAIEFQLGEAQVGSLISAYMGGCALLALFAPVWMKVLPWKATAMAAYGVFTCGAILLVQGGSEMLTSAMFIMGLGSIVLFSISVGVIAAARDPDRGFGLKLTAEMILGAVMIFVVAKFVASVFGFSGFVYGMLLLYVATACGILWLPNKSMLAQTQSNHDRLSQSTKWHAPVAAVALFLFFGAYTAVWSFAGILGLEHGLIETQISTALTLALLAGLGGALLCAWLGQSQGHLKPMMIGMALMALGFLTLTYSQGFLLFVVAICVINGLLQFVVAYQMGLLAMVDLSGRFTALIAFILASSAALSGDLMGSLIENFGLPRAILFATAAVMVAMGLTALVLVTRKHPQQENRDNMAANLS